jgi:hypothetical protein
MGLIAPIKNPLGVVMFGGVQEQLSGVSFWAPDRQEIVRDAVWQKVD